MVQPVESTSSSAQSYHRIKLSLFFVSFIIESIFLCYIYLSGSATTLMGVIEDRTLYLFTFFMLLSLFMLPVDYARGYWLERRYQMSTQNTASWWIDHFKKSILSILYLTALYSGFYFLLSRSPDHWWLWAALLSTLLAILLNIVFPVFLIPIFYKLSPLSNANIAAEIKDTCIRCGIKPLGAYEIKLSQKTKRANAAVVGIGKTRRVLLSDTLLASFSPEEIRMVIAHEIGHHVKKHIGRTTLITAILGLIGFFVVSVACEAATLSNPGLLPIILLVTSLTQLIFMPLACGISRKHEKEADAYALKIYPELNIFKTLIQKLSAFNLANPDPSALEEWFFYTHPSARNRIRAAELSDTIQRSIVGRV